MEGLISVIMPVYNGKNFIGGAIESVLNQSYPNLELIVIDDGSTDSTKDIVLGYAQIDARCKYSHQNNRGAGAARNYALGIAKGEMIAFCDADDLVHPDYLSRHREFLIAYPQFGLSYCNVSFIDEEGDNIGRMRPDIILENKEDWRPYALYRQCIPAVTAIMIRREVVDKGYRYSEKSVYGEDVRFIFDMSAEFSFGYLDEYLYYYRRHSHNVTNNPKKKEDIEKINTFTIDEIKEMISHSNFEKADKVILFSNILIGMKEYEKAVSNLDEGICLYGKGSREQDYSICFSKGVALYEMHSLGKAYECFCMCAELCPGRAESYNNMGCCEYGVGNIMEGTKWFRKAMDKRPGYMDAQGNFFKARSCKPFKPKLTERELMRDMLVYGSEEKFHGEAI